MSRPPSSTRETAPQTPEHLRGVPVLVVSSSAGVVSVPIAGRARLTLGRSSHCDVPVLDDSVSREHVVLHTEGGLTIEDLGSRNGTRLAGKRLTPSERVPLSLGAVVELGSATLVVHIPQASSGPASARRAATAPRSTRTEGPILADPAMQRLYALLDIIAPSPLPVLLLGETGTGKDVFARAVHARSERAARAFVPLHCVAVPDALLESELFGHEKGAFTGAGSAKPGLIESAEGGTLFLDEIGELPPSTQAKLLRVLESGEVLRIGSVKARVVDFRIVAATNRDLAELVADGKFRADLYYRINGFSLTLPPLRDRTADVMPLAQRFARLAATRAKLPCPDFAKDATAALIEYGWPGNVRELRHVVERAVTLARGASAIDAAHLLLPTGGAPIVAAASAGEPEKRQIVDALQRTSGNQTEAAKLLGISRRALSNKLDKYGVGRPRKQ